MIVRVATVDDAAAIARLHDELDSTDRSYSPAVIQDWFATMQRYPDYRLLVAENSTGIHGSYTLCIMDNLGHGGAGIAIVEGVIVASAARGLGIGKAMMQDAMQRAQQSGCYKITLSSNLKRKQAHAFYDSLGFERHGYSFQVCFA